MVEAKLKNNIKIAGQDFIVEHAELVTKEFNHILSDSEYKNKIAENIFYSTTKDTTVKKTIIHLNALLKIIKEDQIYDALLYVITSPYDKNKDQEVIDKAKKVLVKIKTT